MADDKSGGSPVVHPYSPDKLADLLVEASARSEGERENRFVRRKHHLSYLQEYLRTLACASIIVEPGYVDRDFLEDFSAYHVRSFHPYARLCTRLHFLKTPLTQDQLTKAMLRKEGAPNLQNSYLGFVVLRPLPLTVIGRTCLRTYPATGQKQRIFPTLYRQEIDLYGMRLHVESVAFQEQDRDVAACATSALWSVLQCTGRKFQHAIPSPVAITGTAAATGGYDERMLPAVAGLTIRQIADTLRYVGLEPHLIPLEKHKEEGGTEVGPSGIEGTSPDADEVSSGAAPRTAASRTDAIERTRLEFKAAVAAYLRAGIPCLLLMRVTEATGREPERDVNHAVAVTGYRLGRGPATGYGESGVMLDASRIDKIFVHDDQVGPFAKMKFAEDGTLDVSWPIGGGQLGQTLARSHTLVVPLNHKIRVPFATVLKLTLEIGRRLDGALESFPGSGELLGEQPVSWDIQLSSLRDLRKEIAESDLADGEKKRLLESRMPKHLWRIIATIKDGAVLELLLDATDLVQGEMLVDTVVYASQAAILFGTIFSNADHRFDTSPAHRRIRRALAALALRAPASPSKR
ncbi:hypothetical protein [Sphingomonas sp. ABOLH]|uniref:hypothetical protein n=1 Tax=Sphingomonas sp. ABOLH TaxID=1985881 RepID=UPI000F7EF1BE|nr:hypothetical protein [Sphingomonas sp. ABOLH]